MGSSMLTSVMTGRTIPKDLAGIEGVECGFQPSPPTQARLLISGPPGSGKSTFLNSCPHLLMLDEERGGKTVADPAAMRFTAPAKTPPEERDQVYLDFVDKIIARKLGGADDIRIIGIDSYNELIETFSRAACLREGVIDLGDVGGGHGKGYAMVRTAITGMLDRIYKAGMGWAVIAHSTIDDETKTSRLDVSNSFQGAIHRKCEHFLWVSEGVEYIEQPPVRKTVKGRVIESPQPPKEIHGRFIQAGPGGLWRGGSVCDVKTRIPLPDQFRIPSKGGWPIFEEVYNEAIERLVADPPQATKTKKGGPNGNS